MVENDEASRNGEPPLEKSNEILRSYVAGRQNNVGWAACAKQIAEGRLLVQDMSGARIAAMGKIEARKVEHIVASVAAGQDTDMDVLEKCEVQLTGRVHNVEGYDGSVYIAGRVHHASTPVPAGGVDHGSG